MFLAHKITRHMLFCSFIHFFNVSVISERFCVLSSWHDRSMSYAYHSLLAGLLWLWMLLRAWDACSLSRGGIFGVSFLQCPMAEDTPCSPRLLCCPYSWSVSSRPYVMMVLCCQLDRIWSPLGDKPGDTYMRGFLPSGHP